jgi:hypothetical protein
MRGRLAAVVLWCAATAGATTVVLGGIGTIRDATRRDTSAGGAAQAVQTFDTVGTWSTTSVSVPATTSASQAGPARPSTSLPAAASTPAGGTPSNAGATAATPTAPTATAGATTTRAAPATTTTAALAPTAPAPAVTRTVSARGGTATIRLGSDEVVVVAATPNAGYTARVSRRSVTSVRVEFERDGARSRIDAWWDTEARVDVRED